MTLTHPSVLVELHDKLVEATHWLRGHSLQTIANNKCDALRHECAAFLATLNATPTLLSLPVEILTRILAHGDASMLSALDGTCTMLRTMSHGGQTLLDAACVGAAVQGHGLFLSRIMPKKTSAPIRLAWLEDVGRAGQAWGSTPDEMLQTIENALDHGLFGRLHAPKLLTASGGCMAFVAASLLSTLLEFQRSDGADHAKLRMIAEAEGELFFKVISQDPPLVGREAVVLSSALVELLNFLIEDALNAPPPEHPNPDLAHPIGAQTITDTVRTLAKCVDNARSTRFDSQVQLTT